MFNSVRLSEKSLFAFILMVICLTCSALAQGGKGYKGHPITFEPGSIIAELALNGGGQQTVSFTSQETLQNVAVWVVPEIWSFVTVEPDSFDTIETGQVYELTITLSVPEEAVSGYYDGTIHLRDGRRTLAKPLPLSIEVFDEWILPESNWPYRRCDLAGSACNPNGSSVYAGDSLTFDFGILGTDHYVLTGDVDGDGEVEIITTSGDTLNIHDGTGALENSIALLRDCQLSMLEDADGDGVLDIGLGGRGHGFEGYIYKSDGTLLKTLAGQHGGSYGDHSMIPLTISNGKVLVGYNAGYSRTPRGVASFDYATGIEEWYYQIGPANGWYSVVDMDADGTLDITMNSHTVHNGASGNGTTDGDIYLVVVDEDGAKSITQKYPSPSNGWAMHMFADMDGDGMQEILAFEGHDSRYYPGQAQIHIYDSTGATLHTFNGPANTGWDYAVGDLDNDGFKEIIVSARDADTLYILDNQLQLIDSTSVDGRVKLICDLTGDGYKEIVLLDNDGWIRILDMSLAQIAEVQCGNKNGNVIASDVDVDGVVELLVQTDQLYVYSFSEDSGQVPDWPLDAAEFNGHYYKVFTERLSWKEADEHCRQMNGFLACISTVEENEFILDLARENLFPVFTCAWIGASDAEHELQWSWISGEPMLMWANLLAHGGTHENYLNLRLATGQWEDYPICGEVVGEQWFVCEWDSYDNIRQESQDINIKVAESREDYSTAQESNGVYSGYDQVPPSNNVVKDCFNDGDIDSIWSCFSNGCVVAESGGELKIQGTTVVNGWGNGNGLITEHFWPEGDFDVSVDFLTPTFSGSGTRLIYLMAKGSNSESVGLFYSYDLGYRVQSWEPRQFSDWLKPFGNEDSSYHTMRLIYDSGSETLTGYIDDALVGSLHIKMGGDVAFTIQAASETADMVIDTRFDNFKVTRYPYANAATDKDGLVEVGTYEGQKNYHNECSHVRSVKVADSVEDFSSTQGNNGWYYGYSDGNEFSLLDQFMEGHWTLGGQYWTSISASDTHPNSTVTSGGKDPVNHSTIRRWVCAESGRYQIWVTISDPGTHLAADGVMAALAGQVINLKEGDTVSSLIDTTLAEGDIVDLVVSARNNDYTDSTITRIQFYRLTD